MMYNKQGGSAWTAGQSDFGQYLIIDLGEIKNISSIGTQGRPYTAEYIQEFRIDYGNDGQDFATYRDRNGNIKVGNTTVEIWSLANNTNYDVYGHGA